MTPWRKEKMVEGVDVPFGPPPEYYNYRCSQCGYECELNEAIIDAAVLWAEYYKKHDGGMPILECPHCTRDTFIYSKKKSPPERR